jgi:plastocyanin
MRIRTLWLVPSILAAALVVASCGGGGTSTPTSPSPSATPSPTPTPSADAGTTITISASGVSPKVITVAAGSRVTFVNNDTRAHEMDSNPHPEHTDCVEINQVGFLQPGQSKQTGTLNTRRSCGYHDHNQDTNTAFQGTIVVQ